MLRSFIGGALALILFALGALADEYKGKIKSYDAGKDSLTLTIGEKDQEFKVAPGVKVSRGEQEVPDGIKNPKFGKAVGIEVTVVTEKKDGAEAITAIRIVGKKKK